MKETNFYKELNKKINLKGIENFNSAILIEPPYPYLRVLIVKDNIESIDFYLENNIVVISEIFFYEGDDLLANEIQNHFLKKFKRSVLIKVVNPNTIQSTVRILANRTLNKISFTFSFENFKNFEEVHEFSKEIIKEFIKFIKKKKGIIVFNDNKEIIKKVEKQIVRL
ncbi:MAG: hypothetical protein ABGW69_03225 [Nanoarchaeota archaeon]